MVAALEKVSFEGLSEWQREDLEDLCEKYPDLNAMTDEELDRLSRKLYWDAQGLYDQVNRMESEAENIKLYLFLRKGMKV